MDKTEAGRLLAMEGQRRRSQRRALLVIGVTLALGVSAIVYMLSELGRTYAPRPAQASTAPR